MRERVGFWHTYILYEYRFSPVGPAHLHEIRFNFARNFQHFVFFRLCSVFWNTAVRKKEINGFYLIIIIKETGITFTLKKTTG